MAVKSEDNITNKKKSSLDFYFFRFTIFPPYL